MAPALSDGQFEIYLQPKYRIKDSRLAGAEALVRWNHPEWGIQSPAEFIPLFEKNGFITKQDEYVWDRTGAVLRKIGCDCAQGYYYAKPMPEEDFEALLADLKADHTGDK